MEGINAQLNKYPDVDNFVSDLSSESRKKIHKVIMVLFDKSNLVGSSKIEIPFQEFEENRISDNEAIAVLKNLHRNGIAETSLSIDKSSNNKDKPGIGIIRTIIEDERIFNSRAEIYIKEKRFRYLKLQLENNITSKKGLENNRLSENDPLIQTPSRTKWSDVALRFINGNDVEITFKNSDYKKIWDFKELGFYDEKRKCPNLSWKILYNASKYGGKMSWSDLGGISASEIQKKIDSFQKQVSLLRSSLRKIFGILKGSKHEPIISYPNDKEYLITINLITEKSSTKEKERWEDMFSEAELHNYEQLSKKEFIKNPNQNLIKDIDY